ncbi:uncharacterized protein LOC124923904 isoform X2 [Impatiens glandulifera]|uniref:uncharacterized protein LOC124923904 isoform X2 n=1 Tax=Impatiens glandulifera TaxID=253017 RepID=UPI001FB107B5|nr:uncharacterized protein LOC124923904 isoform X2 [Impatiens glandulifera]
MAASTKFDRSSNSPDRQLYTPRGSFMSASLDRLGSFRENAEHPILSSLPSLSRGSSSTSQGDVASFLQCLQFDPKSMALEHKYNRHVGFKRIANVAFGLPSDGSPAGPVKGKPLPSPSLDDLKRLKEAARECTIKARERVKIFSDVLLAMNKCFPNITSRKRSRSDVLTTDRSNVVPSSDRSFLKSGMGKIGSQSHATTSSFDLEPQRTKERTKLPIPNKRTRTSMVDMKTEARPNTPARPSGNADRDKETLRFSNSGAAQGEDRSLSVGVDGWEKSKIKKKRSGIKHDLSPCTGTSKANDGYREPKQGVHHKVVADVRSRVNDSHGSRLGVPNGLVGVGKTESAAQPSGAALRSSIPHPDQDSSSIAHDRKEHPADKEKVNFRVLNKVSAKDDINSTSPTTSNKLHPSVRAPRSASNAVPKMSQVVQRASDWELSQCTNKLPLTIRKRMPSARSSSPPVAHWAGQRPQKISRMARRSNLVPIVGNTDDHSALDAATTTAASENVSSHARHLLGSSPQKVKSKVDHTSSTTLSGSEESGIAETKCREKGKKFDEKASHSALKDLTLVLPPQKNKLVCGDDLGDGVRRHGRSGRGHSSTRSLMPITNVKIGKVGTAKQLRNTRLGSDKAESKAYRPPTRKLSDRKTYTRQKHTTINASDFLVGSDDGNEELLAAAAAVSNHAACFPSSFWRQMEPFFGYISDADIAYLKQQGGFESAAPALTPPFVPSSGFMENRREINELRSCNLDLGTRTSKEVPLCQRLIAALISEDDFLPNQNGDLESDVYGCSFDLETDIESSSFNSHSRGNFQVAHAGYNSHAKIQNYSSRTEMERPVRNNSMVVTSDFGSTENGIISDQVLEPHITCSEFQYGQMSFDERVLLELQSIGICPESVGGDEEVSEDIRSLEDKFHEQVPKKKVLFERLVALSSETKERQEKEFEQQALDKLGTMAYEKYMSCHGLKSASSKMAKQASMSFIKRTLDRCHQYEDTGKSCFGEPIYRDMFICSSSYPNDALPDVTADGETSKQGVSTPRCSLEVRASGPFSSQQSPSLSNHEMYSSDGVQFNEETWSNGVKKRELVLDDVKGGMSVSLGMEGSLSSNAKGKRSERDRDREGISRVFGRPTTSNDNNKSSNKGEQRKTKTKPKQKSTQLSASSKMSNNNILDDFNLDILDDLPIPEMDVLGGVPDDLGGQGHDFASWLNIDDDALQDHDNYMGLEIPMDDLADLNMI